MKDHWKAALGRALTDADALFGFGLERVSLAPPLWHESLMVDGRGHVTLRTVRSIADVRGESIGDFRSTLEPAELDALVRTLAASDFDAIQPEHIEAFEMRIEIHAVCDGARESFPIPLANPARLGPVHGLLAALDGIGQAARAHPVSTLALSLTAPPTVRAGDAELPFTLTFTNDGVLGAWIRHPAALATGQPHDGLTLVHATEPQQEPGYAMMPADVQNVPLRITSPADRELLWLAPKSSVALQAAAKPIVDPGPHLFCASYSSYSIADAVAGKRLLRGAVFSQDLRVIVD